MKNMDCRRVLKIGNGLFYSGFLAILLLFAVTSVIDLSGIASTVVIALAVLSILTCAGGVLFTALRLVCPRCGKSLLLGGRMPHRLPDYCPHCGEKLEP
jgi:ribosomal protein S27AE